MGLSGATRTLKVVIAGDAKGAVEAAAATDGAFSGLKGKFDKLKESPAAFGLVTATVAVGVTKALYDIGSQFDDAYDTIQVGTGATGEGLDVLKDKFRTVVQDVPTDFGSAATAISLVTQKLGEGSDPTGALTEQFLELSRITKTDLTGNLNEGLSALNNWQVPADQMGGKLDMLFRAGQASGVGFADLTSQLSESGTQLQALGFDFDQATTVVAGLGKAGMSVSDVLPTLSKVMAAGAKEGKSAQDVYQGLIASIKGAPDDVAASTIAFDALGAKAGPKFAALIREGKFSFDQLGETIADGQTTIIGAGKDTQDFSEKWQMFKNKALIAIEPIAKRVFDGLAKGMDWLGKHQGVMQALAIVVGVVLVAAFVAWGISVITAMAPMLLAVAGLVLFLAPIIAVGAAIYELGTHWSEIWEWIKNAASAGGEWVKGIFDATVDLIASLPGRYLDAARGMFDWMVDEAKSAVNLMIGVLNRGIDFINGFQIHISTPGLSIAGHDVVPDWSYDWSGPHLPHIPQLARGGTAARAGWSVVGDAGPELLHMPVGATVVPLDRSPSQGGDGAVHVHFHGPVSKDSEQWVIDTIDTALRKGKRLSKQGQKALVA